MPRPRPRRLARSAPHLRRAFCTHRLHPRLMARTRTSPPRSRLRLPRKIPPRRRGVPFTPQGAAHRPRTRSRNSLPGTPLSLSRIARRLALHFCAAALRWRQLHTGTPRLRKSYSDCLLRRTRPVLSFSHVMDLLPHKFSCLRAGRLAFARVFPRFLLYLSFFLTGHTYLL